MPAKKYTVEIAEDGCYGVYWCGRVLWLGGPKESNQDHWADDYLKPLCPHIRAAKTVAEAQAICDGVVTIGPYTVDYRNPSSMKTTGVPGEYVNGIYSPSQTYWKDALVNKVARASTPAELLTILKESLVSNCKFTVVSGDTPQSKIRILGGHFEGPKEYLYVGGENTESAKRCVVPELKPVIDALNAAPSAAVAQAIIDAHLAEVPKEAKVTATAKVTEEFTVTEDDGAIALESENWHHFINWSDIDEDEPFAALFTKLDAASPTTVSEAVAIIKEFNQ